MCGAETTNMDIISRYTGLPNQTADPNVCEQGGEAGVFGFICEVRSVLKWFDRNVKCIPTVES